MSNRLFPAALAAAFALSACAGGEKPTAAPIAINEDPYPSTYVRYPGVPTVIRHATVFDGDGRRFDNGTLVLADGVIGYADNRDRPDIDAARSSCRLGRRGRMSGR